MASPTLASPQRPCGRGQSGCWSPGAPLRKYPHHGRVTEDTCRVPSQGRASPTWHRRFSIGMSSLQLARTDAALTTQDKCAGGQAEEADDTRRPPPGLRTADVEAGSAYLSLPCSSYGPRPSSLSEMQPHQANEPVTGPPPPTPPGALNPLRRDRTLSGHQVWFRLREARVVSPGQYAGSGKWYKEGPLPPWKEHRT